MKDTFSVQVERQAPAIILIVTTVAIAAIAWLVCQMLLGAAKTVNIVMAYSGPIDTTFIKLMFALAFTYWFLNGMLTWAVKLANIGLDSYREMKHQVRLKYGSD